MSLSRVRGVRDLLNKEAEKFEKVISIFNSYTKKSGYELIILPTLEDSSLYTKTLGDTSDIVSKEMFYIQGKKYVLRPEGTAGALRSYLMNCSLGEKKQWRYSGSMFRHERPQSGRYREFFQFGIENISSATSAASDAEVISIAFNILQQLSLPNTLLLNTLGDDASRASYTKELLNYFSGKRLSKASELRLKSNSVLRILDSKDPEDQDYILDAPAITPHLTTNSLIYYNELKATLEALKVPFIEDSRLVRGLDYYSNACFEFVTDSKAVIGGGRYDNLAGMIDKSKSNRIGGIGWAAGIDRICELIDIDIMEKIVQIVPVGKQNLIVCLQVAQKLRQKTEWTVRIRSDVESLKQHMGSIKGYNPKIIVFVGDDEIKENMAMVKICDTGVQQLVSLGELDIFLNDQNK